MLLWVHYYLSPLRVFFLLNLSTGRSPLLPPFSMVVMHAKRVHHCVCRFVNKTDHLGPQCCCPIHDKPFSIRMIRSTNHPWHIEFNDAPLQDVHHDLVFCERLG